MFLQHLHQLINSSHTTWACCQTCVDGCGNSPSEWPRLQGAVQQCSAKAGQSRQDLHRGVQSTPTQISPSFEQITVHIAQKLAAATCTAKLPTSKGSLPTDACWAIPVGGTGWHSVPMVLEDLPRLERHELCHASTLAVLAGAQFPTGIHSRARRTAKLCFCKFGPHDHLKQSRVVRSTACSSLELPGRP